MTWNVNLLNISIFDTHTVYSYQISTNAGYFVLLYEYMNAVIAMRTQDEHLVYTRQVF